MCFINVFFMCCRLDMTQELLDYLEAGLKMSETGESTGRRLFTYSWLLFVVFYRKFRQ